MYIYINLVIQVGDLDTDESKILQFSIRLHCECVQAHLKPYKKMGVSSVCQTEKYNYV